MKVRDLIKELLNYEMDREVTIEGFKAGTEDENRAYEINGFDGWFNIETGEQGVFIYAILKEPKPEQVEPPKHVPTYFTDGGMIDQYRCSCGWQSAPYFDGAEYAMADWKKHKEEMESGGGK